MMPFEKAKVGNTAFPPAFGADENTKQGRNDTEVRYKAFSANVHYCRENGAGGAK